MRVDGETSGWSDVQKRVGQGCMFSPYLFNTNAQNTTRTVRDEKEIT